MPEPSLHSHDLPTSPAAARAAHLLLGAHCDIVWSTKTFGQFDADQPSWRAFTGQTEAELLGRGWLNALHPDDRNLPYVMPSHLTTVFEAEYRLRHVSGAYRNVIVVDRHRDANGDPLTSGAAMFYLSGGGSVASYTYDMIGDEFTGVTGAAPCLTPGNLSAFTSNLDANGNVVLYPWWTATRQGHGVSKMIATYPVTDMVGLSTQDVKWLTSIPTATDRTVRAAGTWIAGGGLDQTSSAGASIAVWWSDP